MLMILLSKAAQHMQQGSQLQVGMEKTLRGRLAVGEYPGDCGGRSDRIKVEVCMSSGGFCGKWRLLRMPKTFTAEKDDFSQYCDLDPCRTGGQPQRSPKHEKGKLIEV